MDPDSRTQKYVDPRGSRSETLMLRNNATGVVGTGHIQTKSFDSVNLYLPVRKPEINIKDIVDGLEMHEVEDGFGGGKGPAHLQKVRTITLRVFTNYQPWQMAVLVLYILMRRFRFHK